MRATYVGGGYSSYQFTYNSDSIPHLTAIANSIGTGEAYGLSYSSFTLEDPFTSSSFGSMSKLTEVSLPNDSSANYQFTTDSSGELTKAQLIYGGYIRWTYSAATYSGTGSRKQMEVSDRHVSADGSTEQDYPIYHESGTSSLTIHSCTMIDTSSAGEKYWTFSSTGSSIGLVTHTQGRAPTSSPCSATPASTAMTQNDYTWDQDTAGNNYLGAVVTTLDPGSYAVQSTTTQTLDTNGNVTALCIDSGSNCTSSGYRKYAYTYLTSSAYTSRYIFNRLYTATVTTNGSTFTTLASATYDGSSLTGSATPLAWDTSYSSVTARGNPTSMTDVSGITTTTAYDLYGNVTNATDASGVNSTASTSSTTNYAAPDSVTVASSLTTSMTYNSFLGTTSATGPNSSTVDISYDTNARPTSTTSPFGAVTYIGYTDTGSTPNVCTSTNTRWTQNFLDGLGRTLHTKTGSYSTSGSTGCTSSGTTLSTSDTTYGAAGAAPLGMKLTQNVPYTSSAGATTTYSYDGIGRILSKAVVGSDTSGTTTYAYAGNTVTVTDPAGKVKAFTLDAFGNLVGVFEDPSGLGYTTTYTYDVLNHLTGVSMTRSTGTQTRSWSYTGNFLMSATNPENGTISYTYNTGGNNKVSQRTDAKGQATVYTYDSLARLTEVQRYPSGTGNPEDTCQRENYVYDGTEPSPAGGYPVYPSYPQNALGRLSGVMYLGGHLSGGSPTCDTTFIELYTYNAGGAPTGKLLQVDRTFYVTSIGNEVYGINFTAGFSYDNEGRMTGIQYPAMVDEHSIAYTPDTLSYTYDSMGRPYTATDTTASQTLIAGASYGPANELVSITGASGGWGGESFAHNSIKQLTCLSTSSSCTSSTGVIYNYPSSANNGKIASQADGVSGETVTYTYDNLNRLQKAENQCTFSTPWGQSFTYDGFGNLTNTSIATGCSGYSAPTFSQTYDANNHAGTVDSNGNPASIYLPQYSASSAATWDVENRLTSTGGGTIFYSYAPGSRRVWKGSGTWTYPIQRRQRLMCNTGQWSTGPGSRLLGYQRSEVDDLQLSGREPQRLLQPMLLPPRTRPQPTITSAQS